MSRLTEKRKKPLITGNEETIEYRLVRSYDSCINKLGKLEDLEEQLGCPFEVRCAVIPDSYIYTFGTTMENQDVVTQRHIVTISKEGFTILYATATGKERKMELSWKAYKKTWWLKENKSE